MKKPVVATDVASLPEVVSGRYVLVEPRNPKAIVGVLRRFIKARLKIKVR